MERRIIELLTVLSLSACGSVQDPEDDAPMSDADDDDDVGNDDDDATSGGGDDDDSGIDDPLTDQWHDITPECMGPGRVFGVDDPNPKKGDACEETCNVPCGFEDPSRPGIASPMFQQIGNKVCTCDVEATKVFVSPCSCAALPSVANLLPVTAGSCETQNGAPAAGTWDQGDDNLFVDHMDGRECDMPYSACVGPDLPIKDADGSCEWTTPKGCLCLGGEWDCRSTSNWFGCMGNDCPQAFLDVGIVDGDIKGGYCGQ